VPTKEELDKGFRLGDWEVIPSRRILRRGDEELTPEPKVFGVLMALALRGGDAVTRDELIDEVWDGRPTGDEPINRCIAQLRNHLGDKRPYRYIKALTGSGYLLQEKVVLNEPDPAKANLVPVRASSRGLRAVVVLALIGMAVMVIWKSIEPPPSGVRSIGVLPFVNVSGNPDNQYIAEGFKTELVKALQQIPDVVIRSGRDAYPTKSASEIAGILDVDSVLLGSVNRSGDELKVSYELFDRVDNMTRIGGTLTGDIDKLFAFQGEVADAVHNDIVGTTEQHLVSSSRPSNFEAYDSYLQGAYAFDRRGNDDNLEDAIRLFEETLRLDPGFGPAYLQLATAYALLPRYKGASLENSNHKAIEKVEEGIIADSSIRDAAGAVYGYIYHNQKEWAKAELAFQQATNAAVVDSNAFNWYSRMLASVGRLDAALEQALRAFELDPDSAVVNSRVALSYSWLGDAEKASEFFERSRRLGAEGTTHLMGWALFLSREGDLDKSREIAKIATGNGGFPPEWIDPVISGLFDAEMSAAALQAVNDAVSTGEMPRQIEVVARTMLGDIDGAMQVANLLEQPGEVFEMDLLWIPEFRPLRQHPDFLTLMERLGIVEYWSLHACEFEDAAVSCADD
jgi:DNA-binding winged helix-turn-helix (wHTH) protein/TolB-like protein